MRGVRRLIQNQPDPDYVLQAGFPRRHSSCCRNTIFRFDICIFHHQLPNTLEMVRRCPEVSFVLDHIAKPGDQGRASSIPGESRSANWRRCPTSSASSPGVTTEADHAAWTREQLRPYIDHVIECFGVDRVIYGGDWPVSELAGTYAPMARNSRLGDGGIHAGGKAQALPRQRDQSLSAEPLMDGSR